MVGFQFEVEGTPHEFSVLEMDGTEALSRLYEFDLVLSAPELTLDFEELVGKGALLTLVNGGMRRWVHGTVAQLTQDRTLRDRTVYRARMVPWVWRLYHRRDCHIFQAMTVPDIVAQVLKQAGMPGDRVRFELGGSPRSLHPAREYCVQYRESDWSFVSRLLEEEGLFYFFEHHEDRHVLVVADHQSVHRPIAEEARVSLQDTEGVVVENNHVKAFQYAQQVCPTRVTTRDFNYLRPATLLESSRAAGDAGLEDYDYPGEYDALDAGNALADVRLELARHRLKVGTGEGACVLFAPGYTFDLAQHPRAEFNRRYLITGLRHRGVQHGAMQGGAGAPPISYANHFECIPAEVPFRPERRTARPEIVGVQTAIVVGPPGEEIYTDEHGRVKVQFHWDRRGQRNAKSSCWIRVSQGVAGPGWGALYIPRVGHEVIVSFIEGDPDRPIITGRVYHAQNTPPCSLPTEKTRSTIRSSSSPGGAGSNELRFEDAAGSEEIYLHGEKDWNIEIKNDKNERVDHNETVSVGDNQVLRVGGSRAVTVSMAASETVMLAKALTVGGAYQVSVIGAMNTTVGAAQIEEVALIKKVIVGQKFELVCGSGKITVEANGRITLEGTTIALKASGPVTVNGSVVELN